MAIGVLKVYVDGNIASVLRAKYGISLGTGLFLFFEEWRNYGQDHVMQVYPQRTYYKYLGILIKEGYIIRECYNVYRIAPRYEDPVKS